MLNWCMKIFLTILLITIHTLASGISPTVMNYKELNKEIDNISLNLTAEEKVSLYFLVLSTQEKITTALASDGLKIKNLELLEKKTLNVFSQLEKHNNKLVPQNIERLRNLYTKMVSDAIELIKEKDDTYNTSSSPTITIILGVVCIFFGLVIGYFLFKTKGITELEGISVDQPKINPELKSKEEKSTDEHKLEIQHLNEYIESLQNELAKYETSQQ